MKVLIDKSFSFVNFVWTAYIAGNKVDIRYMYILSKACCVTILSLSFSAQSKRKSQVRP